MTLLLFLIVSEGDYTHRIFSLWILALILAVILVIGPLIRKQINSINRRLFNEDPLTLIGYTYFSILLVLGLSELLFLKIFPLLQSFILSPEKIIFAVPIFILVILAVLEWRNSRFLNQRLRGVHRYPFRIIGVITILILGIVSFSEQGTTNYFKDSNLINIFSVIGIFGTLIGLVITYEQLRLAEDRIDGYESLYEALDDLLRDRKARFFQFYGTTVIPGHIAFGDATVIGSYRIKFLDLLEHIQDTKKVTIIAPSENVYETTYYPYLNKSYRGEIFTQEKIDALVEKVKEFQHLLDGFNKVNIITIIKTEIDFVDAFYYSNGRTVVYAVPLHYNLQRARDVDNVPDTDTETEIEPTLIGFKTTNRSMVKAFEKVFDKLATTLNDTNQPNTNH